MLCLQRSFTGGTVVAVRSIERVGVVGTALLP